MTYFATTDYLNLCGFHGDPPDYPRSGAGCARIISYKITPVGGVSYREYLHGTLSEPLKADSIYYVEFYVRPSQKPPADEISYISDYHLHFSVNPIDTIGTTDWVLRLEPHISNQNGIVLDTGWTKVSGCYQALGGEQYITIGNFLPDSLTTAYTPPGSSGKGNVSIVDDVSVVPVGLETFLPHVGQKICVGGCIAIDNPLAGQYQWFFEGGTPENSNLQSPQVCYDSAGVFDIQVVVEHCAGKDTFLLEDAVEVFEKPVSLSDNFQEYVLSVGDTMTLSACSEGETYQWLPAADLSCTDCPNPTLTASQTDTLMLLVSNGSTCTDTCRYHIIVGTPPLAAFTPAASKICQGDCLDFSFSGSGQVDGYSWLFPGGQPSSSTQASPQRVCYPEAGSYPVMLVVHNTFGTDTLRLENAVTVVPEVVVTSAAEQRFELAFGDSLQLEPCALGQSYQWSPADGLSCTDCPNPLLTATIPATYTLEVSNDGMCIASCQYVVEVAFDQPGVYIPSAFSPNGDGINDLFTAYGKFLQIERLLIFHRWGGMAYEAHGPDAAWDGTSKDKPAQPGVYVYLLEYTDTRTGERFMKSGEVVLVR